MRLRYIIYRGHVTSMNNMLPISVMNLLRVSHAVDILQRPGVIRFSYIGIVGSAERDDFDIIVDLTLRYRLRFEHALVIGANVSCGRWKFEFHSRRTVQRAGVRLADASAVISAIETQLLGVASTGSCRMLNIY